MRRRTRLLSLVVIGGSLVPRTGVRAGGDNQPEGPRVVAAWAAGPFEARVAFDRPIGAGVAGAVVGRTIAFDEARPFVHAKAAPSAASADTRGSLRVVAARTDDDGRTLVLTTDPHPRAATYTLDLPLGAAGQSTEVAYDLTGVEVLWYEDGQEETPAWTAWWPALDPAVVRKDLGASAEHARSLARLGRKGRLSLTTFLSLPKGPATLSITASGPVEPTLNGEAFEAADGSSIFRADPAGDPMLLGVLADTGRDDRPFTLRVSVQGGSGRETSLAPEQMVLPWVPASPPPPAPLENIPDLTGGDPIKGAAVFASEGAKCASCHRVRGEGGAVGPDLSGFVGRDRKGVYRDIAEPSAKIHPDYVPYTVALKDGRVLVGTVRAEGANAIRLSDTEAKVTVVPRAEVEEFRPGVTSVMPVGLAGAIGEEKLRDLIAFLTTAPAK